MVSNNIKIKKKIFTVIDENLDDIREKIKKLYENQGKDLFVFFRDHLSFCKSCDYFDVNGSDSQNGSKYNRDFSLSVTLCYPLLLRSKYVTIRYL